MSAWTFAACLGLMLILLRLTGYVAWSWWGVTAPFWVYASLWLVVHFVEEYRARKRWRERNERLNKQWWPR